MFYSLCLVIKLVDFLLFVVFLMFSIVSTLLIDMAQFTLVHLKPMYMLDLIMWKLSVVGSGPIRMPGKSFSNRYLQ